MTSPFLFSEAKKLLSVTIVKYIGSESQTTKGRAIPVPLPTWHTTHCNPSRAPFGTPPPKIIDWQIRRGR